MPLPVLPVNRTEIPSAFDSKEVTKIALRLKHQVETVIPCELGQEEITKPHSPIITNAVIETARQAGGKDHKSCVVFCLLICKKWFKRQAILELWDADLHDVRAVACEIIAKRMFVHWIEDHAPLLTFMAASSQKRIWTTYWSKSCSNASPSMSEVKTHHQPTPSSVQSICTLLKSLDQLAIRSA